MEHFYLSDFEPVVFGHNYPTDDSIEWWSYVVFPASAVAA
jgi:hypothetical protein